MTIGGLNVLYILLAFTAGLVIGPFLWAGFLKAIGWGQD